MDHVRLVFDWINQAGAPDQRARAAIYEGCREDIAALFPDPVARMKELDQLEKVIRRQEMQALADEVRNGV